MRSGRFALILALFTMAAAAPAAAQDPGANAPLFTAYPSYGAKFDSTTEKFSLISNVLVYNISGQTFTDVSFKQTYPDGVSVKETFRRFNGKAEGEEQSSASKVEGNTFFASIQTYKHRQYVVIANELVMARRLSEITFPGIEVSYTDTEGKRQTAKLPDNTYQIFSYSNVVGDFERFLKKYNKISFDFAKATPNRKEWEFAQIATSAKGRFASGIIGTYPGEDQYNGYFRIRTGPPGDTFQVLVVYNRTDKKDRVADKETLLKDLRDYMRWCGEFEFAQEDLKVEQGKWRKYNESWNVSGRWVDSVKNRLGEGPIEAHVFYSPREDVEYFVVGLAHGRALFEASATPNPEKEAALAAEMHALLASFESGIVPISNER